MERVYRTRLAQRNSLARSAKQQVRKTKCPEQTQTNPRKAKEKILIAVIDTVENLIGRWSGYSRARNRSIWILC
jgi:hypothetical protein